MAADGYINQVTLPTNSTQNILEYTTAYCDTTAATAAKTAVCPEYALHDKTWVHLILKNGNTKNTKITLNINNTGAKDIYINNNVSSSSNYTLSAGDYYIFYSDNKYYFYTSGILPLSGGTLTGGVTFSGDSNSAWNDKGILFTNGSRIGENTGVNALGIYSKGGLVIRPNCSTGPGTEGIEINTDGLRPTNDNTESLGDSSHKWSDVYATTFHGAASSADKIAVTESTEATSYIVSVKDTSGNNDSLVQSTLSITNVISNQTISTTTLNIGTIGHNGYLTLYSNHQNGYTSTLQTPTLTQSVTYTLPSTSGTIALITDKVAAADVADKLTESDVGGASQPIYLAAGVATAGNTYAGGTAVTLNNSSCGSSTASFYAPTSGGTAGYILIGAGTTAEPNWYEGIALTGTALTNYKATFYGTTASTGTSTGTLVVSGGIGTGADSYLQKSVHIVGSVSEDPLIVRSISGCSTTGNRGSTADDTNQGLYLNYNGGPINFGKPNDATAANIVYMNNTQESTSTSTGAVRIYGGASIAKSLWVGTKVAVNNNSITTFGTKGDGQIQLCSSSNYHTQLEFRKGTLSSTTNGYKSWMIGVNYSTEFLSINSDYDSSGSQLTTYGHNILNLNPVSGFAEFTGGISTQELNLANTSLIKKVKLVWNATDESLQFIFI